MKYKSAVLVILDGWGHDVSWGGNAITIAQTSNLNKILRKYPNSLVAASGEEVGLPGHEVGNSEVGHMNLGAGNVVLQDISNINKSILDGSFYKNPVLTKVISDSKNKNTTLHLMGIVSDGGIHSHIVHLFALIKLCSMIGHKDVLIHAFTDGRDTDPMMGVEFMHKLYLLCENLKTGKIATIIGRVFLDRKGDWSHTEKAYDAIAKRIGARSNSPLSAISEAYSRGETDEFIKPTVITGTNNGMKENDAIIFFNFRSDRTRQLTRAFLDPKFDKFKRDQIKNLDFTTFVPYGIELEMGLNGKAAFSKVSITNTLGKYFEDLKLNQFHIAETEKYAHVTYFINGNRDEPYVGEERLLVPSPNVESYALKPEMSGEEVNDGLLKQIKRGQHSLYICNFANADMVGHTGDFKAAVSAVEFLDKKIKEITEICINQNIPLILTADHGNIERMVDPTTGKPHDEHTSNPVPLVVISDQKVGLSANGKLGNVSSTLIDLLELKVPGEYLPSLLIRSH